MNIAFPATLPPGALGDFAVGHTDLHPSSGEISPWNNLSTIFGRYQFENPEMLAMGSFDVALVVIVVMPLLMIAVSFDLLSRERARGTLALTLCAPMSLARMLVDETPVPEQRALAQRYRGHVCTRVVQ